MGFKTFSFQRENCFFLFSWKVSERGRKIQYTEACKNSTQRNKNNIIFLHTVFIVTRRLGTTYFVFCILMNGLQRMYIHILDGRSRTIKAISGK